jgi:hypothetical protein
MNNSVGHMRGPVITIAPSAMLDLVRLGPPGPLDYVVRLAVRGVVHAEVSAVSSLFEHCRLVLTSIVRHSAAAHQHQSGPNRGGADSSTSDSSTSVRRQPGYERQYDYHGLDRSRGRPAAHVQVRRAFVASRRRDCVALTARGCVAQVFCFRTGCVRSGADRGPEQPSMGTALPCHGPPLGRMEHFLMLGCMLNVCEFASPPPQSSFFEGPNITVRASAVDSLGAPSPQSHTYWPVVMASAPPAAAFLSLSKVRSSDAG